MSKLTKSELARIETEFNILATYNEHLDPDLPDERLILERNLSRLQELQGRVLRSLRIGDKQPLKLV